MIGRQHRLLALIGVGLTLALSAAACGGDDDEKAAEEEPSGNNGDERADWPDKLVFGAVPAEESTALEENYQPIVDVLEKELAIEVEFFQATDYAGIIEAQISGKVQLAQYGPFSYVLAKTNGADIDPAGAMVDEEGGEPGYQSYAIAPAGSGVESLADFAGKKVCFVDPGSTSGYLYPTAGLLEEDVDPDEDIEPVFAGGHDASVISVANGDCEVGFAYDQMVETAVEDLGIAEPVDVVWKSEVIAGSPLAVSLDLPESLVTEIRRVIVDLANTDALLAAGLCEGDCPLTDEEVWGYVAVEDSFFDGVRAVCEATEAEACEGG